MLYQQLLKLPRQSKAQIFKLLNETLIMRFVMTQNTHTHTHTHTHIHTFIHTRTRTRKIDIQSVVLLIRVICSMIPLYSHFHSYHFARLNMPSIKIYLNIQT